MSDSTFDLVAARRLLDDVFAPWVRSLGLGVESVDDRGAVLRMPFDEALCREGGVVCGQALMALADTAMVFAVAAASGRYRPMTTVDMTTHLMKPVSAVDVIADARILRLGRTMAFGQALLRPDGIDEPVVTATLAYALLPD